VQTEVHPDASPVSGDVHQLRAHLDRMQGRRLEAPVLPVLPAIASLLPGGGLRAGSAYSIAPSASLLFALLAAASQAGSWCGVVGMPQFGAEAAERVGVDLSRLVLIPEPGSRWLAVTATIAEVLPVVAVRPGGRASDGDVSRLAARLRDRGAVLLVQGPWAQAEASIGVADADWSGLGHGHGYLAGRELTVTVVSRRTPAPRRGRVLLPAMDGTLVPLRPEPAVAYAPLEAVG
jgi:hypothetical protein